MKNVVGSIAIAFVATLGASVQATAAPIVYQDTYDPTDVFLSAASAVACTGTNALADSVTPEGTPAAPCLSLSYSHQLTGFGEFDALNSATFTIYFRDDGGRADGSEKFTVTGDGTSLWITEEPGGSGNPVQYGPLSVMAQLLADNNLNIVVTSNTGDLYFMKSTLDAAWTEGFDDDVVPTPEPASLLLFGAGAIAIAARVRKAKRS